MKSNKKILVFGVGELQKSIIGRAHKMGLFVVGIDPCEDAYCKDNVDAFEVVGGQDYEGTCAVVEKYGIDAIVTAATDKPLVMMARIAEKYSFPFYSVETAQWSTDKFQMKKRFELGGVPHARGRLISRVEEADGLVFPVIIKPRDNSGSRGVKLCRNKEDLKTSIDEALENSKLDSVLVEEFLEGPEYSIEGLHHDGKSEVIQFTEKKTTKFPYNVELGHIQPANISEENKQKIREIVAKIGKALNFVNCPSHTELKINERGIFVIETSPRLGGDYITSTLTPLSTGVNLEDELLRIALGETINLQPEAVQYSGIRFFDLEEGCIIKHVPDASFIKTWPHVVDFSFNLKKGEKVNKITSSLNRYGYMTLIADSRNSIDIAFERYEKTIRDSIQKNESLINMQRKLLVLGSNYSTKRVVEYAHEKGLYVIVASRTGTGDAAEIAEESVAVELTDHDAMIDLIHKKGINGIMTGASEFHVLNMIRLCKKAGLPCYATEKQWDLCQNKRNFKDLCKQFQVPGVPEFSIDEELIENDFPVIVKPVDGCSSRGISICRTNEELIVAKEAAKKASASGKILIERYIDNGGITLDAKYVAVDGEYYLEAFGENIVQGLITAEAKYPSKYLDLFIEQADKQIRSMFKALGYENGPFFFQILPDGDKLYVYEMGLRVSGGMIYNLTEVASGNNTLRMLINYAVTGKMCEKDELNKINPHFNGKHVASLSVPLKEGVIASIEGLKIIKQLPWLVDLTQYYRIGDEISPKHINTLDQLFARITIMADDEEKLTKRLFEVRSTIKIYDQNGYLMNDWSAFDNKYTNLNLIK